jgi:hypothetical protein
MDFFLVFPHQVQNKKNNVSFFRCLQVICSDVVCDAQISARSFRREWDMWAGHSRTQTVASKQKPVMSNQPAGWMSVWNQIPSLLVLRSLWCYQFHEARTGYHSSPTLNIMRHSLI